MAIDPIYLEKILEQVQWIWVIANFPREFLKLKAGSQSRSYSDWWFHTSPNMLVIGDHHAQLWLKHVSKKIKPSIRLLATYSYGEENIWLQPASRGATPPKSVLLVIIGTCLGVLLGAPRHIAPHGPHR